MNTTVMPAALEQKILDVVNRFQDKPGALLSILEAVQEQDPHKYLSEEALTLIAKHTGTPLSRVFSMATFYSFFNLQPQGEHILLVCRGTACHTRGSKVLLEDLACLLDCADFLESGENSFTTKDKKFTIKTVACFGQCALAPVVSIDGVIYSRMTSARLKAIIEKLAKGGKKNE
ncbi:MAG: NAD(P)H-dependent oxidoreductase subunit E [Spirochaetales bacterium]